MLLGVAGVLMLGGSVARAEHMDSATSESAADVGDDYDPWQPFNERMFAFNHGILDRFVVKPAATGWDKVCPDPLKRGLGRAIDNLHMPRRVINNLFQGRLVGAGVEAGRFVVNTSVGVAGFFDVATKLHLKSSEADMGETFGVWGIGAGPYVVAPFLSPLTVRDGLGRVVDTALDPLWLVPFFGGTVMGLVDTVNNRSLHLRMFANVEESSLDLYSSVRNGYLQRRRRVVEDRHTDFVRSARAFLHMSEPESAYTQASSGAVGGGS